MNKEEDRALLHAGSDRTQGAYYFYDMKTKDFRKLADLTPWLPEEKLAPMKPVQYTARDGLTIHGYLTLPAGSDGRNLPVVINPHGGPWARDTWGYDSETQFLANRGLAVLQMNFRGSTGYGRAFWEAGFKQWGGPCRTTSPTAYNGSLTRKSQIRKESASTAAPTGDMPSSRGWPSRRRSTPAVWTT